MKPFSPVFGLPIGISVTFWTLMGLFRLVTTHLPFKKKAVVSKKNVYKTSDIAVVIPAHNEELVIRRCIQALKLSLHPKQIHVISDGSVDKTYRRARMEGCHVSYLNPGRGKAKALKYLFEKYDMFRRYKFIFIVDSDTQIDKDFVIQAFKLLANPKIGVVFGSVRIRWKQHIIPGLSYYFISYRERLGKFLQFCFTYGQTWPPTNVTYVVPGFATIYRSKILQNLRIDTPGILVEDFNLAFQIHRQKICKVGYSPMMIGWDQHPDNLSDYWKQVRRWNIGFFQTVRANGVWPSFFWVSLFVFSFEVLLNSLFILLLPLVLIVTLFSLIPPQYVVSDNTTLILQQQKIFDITRLQKIFIITFVVDYLWTIGIGLASKKPQMLFYGLFFFIMHYITALILISAIVPGFFRKSAGKWTSPKRQVV